MQIDIRPAEKMDDYRACQELQRRAWDMVDLEIVPTHILMSAQKQGGLLLLAYSGERLVGFVFGFLGQTPGGKIVHYSHMLAAAPDVQSQGVGYRLKLAQREAVLAQGLDCIVWTFDPLLSLNAYLNMHKLGAVCRTYQRDLYGERTEGLYTGLPSDRLEVEWWIASEHVAQTLGLGAVGGEEIAGVSAAVKVEHLPAALAAAPSVGGWLRPGRVDVEARAPSVLVEVPADIQAYKSADPGLALEWRLATRHAFEANFARGYSVTDYCRWKVSGERHNGYILSKALPQL